MIVMGALAPIAVALGLVIAVGRAVDAFTSHVSRD